jgi:hypothetical protein
MATGKMPEVAPEFVSASYLPKDVAVGTDEWKRAVKDAYIWME